MIENFSIGRTGKAAKDIWEKDISRYFPRSLHLRAKFLLQIMYIAKNLDDLRDKGEPPSIRLHQLKGKRKGVLAIDIDKISGWRITFKFKKNKFIDVAIENYHS